MGETSNEIFQINIVAALLGFILCEVKLFRVRHPIYASRRIAKKVARYF